MTPAAQTAAAREIDALRAEITRLRRQIDTAPASRLPSITRLIDAAAAEFGATPAQLVSYRRMQRFVIPRQVVMHLAVTRLGHSLLRVGACLARDHSTVFHGVRAVSARIAADPAFAARVDRVAQAAIPTTAEEQRP